jgi:hypothetical protein
MRWILIAGIVACVLIFLYSALGLLQAIFLFGTGPGASVDRVVSNSVIWGGLMLICLGLVTYLLKKVTRK